MKFNGLTLDQVTASRTKHGTNRLSVKESQSLLSIFIESFKDKWILILLGALAISATFNLLKELYPDLGHPEWVENYSLALAILLATGFATVTSYLGERAFNNLQAEAGRIPVKVYRDGQLVEILIDDIVVGDEILLQQGDKVPADGYILDGACKVNQASLNGESEDATKIPLRGSTVPEGDLFHEELIFRGTVLTSGECVMKATKIGDSTVIGSINTALQEEGKQSPSKEKLEKLANGIGVVGYTAGGLYFIINMILGYMLLSSQSAPIGDWVLLVLKTLMYSVTIVIMAVPEGLLMMLAMVASMNSRRLMKENILVRNPDSIETAGYTNILFSDKTGTITQGVLSVVDFIDGEGGVYDSINKLNDNLQMNFILGMGLNNDSIASDGKAIGSNGTDRALRQYLIDHDLKTDQDTVWIQSKEQFSSATKYASVTLDSGVKLLKGAAEVLIAKSTHYLKNSKEVPLTKEMKDRLNDVSLVQANRSMRLLALCYEKDEILTLVGLVCIRDNLREGMRNTIQELNGAGVQVVMVTGDRKETAVAIAKEAGIIKEATDLVLTHDELAKLTDTELRAKLPFLKVVSRALPMDKKRLVNIAQELGMVVGMTGDGTNDAPALKSADVGFSMGDGSETAKESSDIVILNNSLTSIERAILNGRTMTESVKKFIIFQLTVNVACILISIIGPLVGFKEPFTIVQILWINLIMDTLAAIAFGGEPAIKDYLKNKPIGREESLVTKYMKTHIGSAAIFITIGSLAIFLNLLGIKDWVVAGAENAEGTLRTFIFTFFIYSVLFNSLNTRSRDWKIFKHITKNPKFIVVMSLVAIGQSFIIQYGGEIFSTVKMDLIHFLGALGLASLIVPIDMIRKKFIK